MGIKYKWNWNCNQNDNIFDGLRYQRQTHELFCIRFWAWHLVQRLRSVHHAKLPFLAKRRSRACQKKIFWGFWPSLGYSKIILPAMIWLTLPDAHACWWFALRLSDTSWQTNSWISWGIPAKINMGIHRVFLVGKWIIETCFFPPHFLLPTGHVFESTWLWDLWAWGKHVMEETWGTAKMLTLILCR